MICLFVYSKIWTEFVDYDEKRAFIRPQIILLLVNTYLLFKKNLWFINTSYGTLNDWLLPFKFFLITLLRGIRPERRCHFTVMWTQYGSSWHVNFYTVLLACILWRKNNLRKSNERLGYKKCLTLACCLLVLDNMEFNFKPVCKLLAA